MILLKNFKILLIKLIQKMYTQYKSIKIKSNRIYLNKIKKKINKYITL